MTKFGLMTKLKISNYSQFNRFLDFLPADFDREGFRLSQNVNVDVKHTDIYISETTHPC